MIVLRNIIVFLLLLILATIAVVGIMIEAPPVLGWTPDRINALGYSFIHVMRPGYGLLMMWAGVLLLSIVAAYLTFARKKMKLEVQMEGGKVIILDSAIKKYIRTALSDLPDVHVKKIDLVSSRGKIVSNLLADVRTRESLPVLERKIIDRVRRALSEDLGITNLGEVNVLVKNFDVTGRQLDRPKTKEAAAAGAVAAGTAAVADSAINPEPEPEEEVLVLTTPLETENISADLHTIVTPEHPTETSLDEEPLVKYANREASVERNSETSSFTEMTGSAHAAPSAVEDAETHWDSNAKTGPGEVEVSDSFDTANGFIIKEDAVREDDTDEMIPVQPDPFAFPSDEEAIVIADSDETGLKIPDDKESFGDEPLLSDDSVKSEDLDINDNNNFKGTV